MPKERGEEKDYRRSPWMPARYPAPGPTAQANGKQEPQLKKIFAGEPRGRGGVFFVKILIVFLVVGAIAFFFYTRGPRGERVGLEFVKPSSVLLGEPFTFSVSASNYSDGILKNAKLSVRLPEGISFLGQPQNQRVMEQAIGDIGPGSVNQQSFNLIVTSGGDSVKRIEAKLAYSPPQNTSVQFESAAEADLAVGQPAV